MVQDAIAIDITIKVSHRICPIAVAITLLKHPLSWRQKADNTSK
jgi:hypothetical protein